MSFGSGGGSGGIAAPALPRLPPGPRSLDLGRFCPVVEDRPRRCSRWIRHFDRGSRVAVPELAELAGFDGSPVVGFLAPTGGSDVGGVGGGPFGEQLDDVWVEGDHAVVAELADWDAQPVAVVADAMTRLRQEAHARMLGNGMCTRPVELDCRMETICETCAYFETGPQFVPVLLRQRAHARTHQQNDRAKLYDTLITQAEASSP